jgi:peptidoglycan-associated lipoprotein
MYKRQAAWIVVILCVAVVAAPGCVSKKSYETGMEDLDGRVVAVESAVEANQKRINDLSKSTDQKVNSLKADNQKSMQVGQQAMTKATAAEKAAQGKLVWKVVIKDDGVKFDFGKASITSSGITELDKLAKQLKSKGRALFLEIEGHTDSVGPEKDNMVLGKMRAGAVRNYLNEKGGIPLHAMNTISLGESRPVADNSTKEGRAENRRVVIKVLE